MINEDCECGDWQRIKGLRGSMAGGALRSHLCRVPSYFDLILGGMGRSQGWLFIQVLTLISFLIGAGSICVLASSSWQLHFNK